MPTAWRTLEAIDDDALARIAVARAAARERAWAAGADPGFYVIDFDGTLVNSHSEKEAGGTDLQARVRVPSAARVSGRDRRSARRQAAARQRRIEHRGRSCRGARRGACRSCRSIPHEHEVIARTDSAALTHGFIDACRARAVRFAVGHDLTEPVRTACLSVPKRRWQPAITADGTDEREDAAGRGDHRPGRSVPLARRHPDDRASRTTPSRRTVDLHRHRRAPLPSVHHRPRRPRHRISRSAAPRSRPLPRNGSATPKTPALRTCRPRTSRSTPRGCNSCSSRKTSSPGPSCCASTATSPTPNRNGSATASSTPPGSSSAAAAALRLRIANGWPWADQLVTAFARVHTHALRT